MRINIALFAFLLLSFLNSISIFWAFYKLTLNSFYEYLVSTYPVLGIENKAKD